VLWNVTPIADRLVGIADAAGPDRRADEALALLIDIGDPRAPAMLTRELRHRPTALTTAAGHKRALPFDPMLLDAIRDLLRDEQTRLGGLTALPLLRAWGKAAASAVPEVLGLLPEHPMEVAATLMATGGVTTCMNSAVRRSRSCWQLNTGWVRPPGNASPPRRLPARSVPAATGWSRRSRRRSARRPPAAQAAGEIGPDAEPLVPLIVPMLQSPGTCADGVLALLRIKPDLDDVITSAADRLVDALAVPYSNAAIEALRALGTRLPPQVLQRLRVLAEQDEDIIADDLGTQHNRRNHEVRTAIRELLSEGLRAAGWDAGG
jgi:hypothetical protein